EPKPKTPLLTALPNQSPDPKFATVGAVYDRPRSRNFDIVGGHRSYEEIGSSVMPLLASPQGGVAERSKKLLRSLRWIARPGWFSDENKRKTTPAASASVAARNLLDDAATSPCGDARRGITLDPISSQLHRRPLQSEHYFRF